MRDIVIRVAQPADQAAIRAVEVAAFPAAAEADLVEALRGAGDVVLELIAEKDGRLAGHVLFSRLWVERGDDRYPAVSLAPLAVLPDHQRQGIGGALVAEGHRLLSERENLSVVLGEPDYYGRFGYTHARAAGFESDYQGECLQALAWGGAPASGRLLYAVAFGAL